MRSLTWSSIIWVLAIGGAGLTAAAPARAAAIPPCVGDCRNDGSVSIADLILGVNISLGSQPLSACNAMDGEGNGDVSISDLIRAVNNSLNGCPATPTA